MGYVATHRRPLLVPDLSRDYHLPAKPRRATYQTNSFMVIPLTGQKFWGVINLADRQDGRPFGPRDLFLGWLMGQLLVEILEAREAPEESAAACRHRLGQREIPVGLAFLNQNPRCCNPTALVRLTTWETRDWWAEVLGHLGLSYRSGEAGGSFFHVSYQQEPQNLS
jgi:hypothetical protein